MVRVGGFEPPRSRFQSEEADQTALHPHICLLLAGVEETESSLLILEISVLPITLHPYGVPDWNRTSVLSFADSHLSYSVTGTYWLGRKDSNLQLTGSKPADFTNLSTPKGYCLFIGNGGGT